MIVRHSTEKYIVCCYVHTTANCEGLAGPKTLFNLSRRKSRRFGCVKWSAFPSFHSQFINTGLFRVEIKITDEKNQIVIKNTMDSSVFNKDNTML